MASRLTLLLVFLTFGLALLDLGLRGAAESLTSGPHERWFREWPGNPELYRYVPSREFEGVIAGDLEALRPGTGARQERAVVFRTDGRGFLNPGGREREPVNLLVLGDSYAAGLTSHAEKTWVERLRRSASFQLYNLAMPGGPGHELLTLRTVLPELELREGATLLWTLFEGNDLDDPLPDSLEPIHPPGALARLGTRWRGFRGRSPLRRGLRSLRARSPEIVVVAPGPGDTPVLFHAAYLERARRTREEVRAHPNWPRLVEIFGAVVETAKSRGLRLRVMVLPSKESIYSSRLLEGSWTDAPHALAAEVFELCGEHGVDGIDPLPHLRREARTHLDERGELLWWRDDSHLDHRGEAILGEFVLRTLGEDGDGG